MTAPIRSAPGGRSTARRAGAPGARGHRDAVRAAGHRADGDGLTGGRLTYLLVLAVVLILAAGVQRRARGVVIGTVAAGPAARSPACSTASMWFVAGAVRAHLALPAAGAQGAARVRRSGRRRAAGRTTATRARRHPVGCRPVTERTLVLVKPDGVARGLVGEVITRLERKGLRLVAAELRTLTATSPRRTTPSTASGRSSARSSSSSPAAR